MNNLLHSARIRRDLLLKELDEVNRLISFYEGRPAPTRPSSRAAANDKHKIIATAEDILREAGKPMRRSELYDELLKRGIEITGQRPVTVLTTILWRSGKFEQVGPRGPASLGYRLK